MFVVGEQTSENINLVGFIEHFEVPLSSVTFRKFSHET